MQGSLHRRPTRVDPGSLGKRNRQFLDRSVRHRLDDSAQQVRNPALDRRGPAAAPGEQRNALGPAIPRQDAIHGRVAHVQQIGRGLVGQALLDNSPDDRLTDLDGDGSHSQTRSHQPDHINWVLR